MTLFDFNRIAKKFKDVIFNFKLRKAIKKANRLAKLTHYRYYVILWKGEPVAIPKKTVKEWVKRRKIKVSFEKMEQSALYITPIF